MFVAKTNEITLSEKIKWIHFMEVCSTKWKQVIQVVLNTDLPSVTYPLSRQTYSVTSQLAIWHSPLILLFRHTLSVILAEHLFDGTLPGPDLPD